MDRTDGVFVSRIALESAVYSSGCIVVGDEILAVNLVDVTRMSLDDVVIIMSIPRRLVLTTRRKKAAPPRFPGTNGGPGGNSRTLDHKPAAPVVVFKGDPDLSQNSAEFAFRSEMQPQGQAGPGLNGGHRGHDSDRAFGSPGRRDQAPFRDSRTLTWDRNPKPDRNDPKYFPVNSLPRQRVPNTTLSPPSDEWGAGQPQQGGGGAETSYGGGRYDNGAAYNRDMPPPMHALPSYQPPPPVVTEQPRLSKVRDGSEIFVFYTSLSDCRSPPTSSHTSIPTAPDSTARLAAGLRQTAASTATWPSRTTRTRTFTVHLITTATQVKSERWRKGDEVNHCLVACFQQFQPLI